MLNGLTMVGNSGCCKRTRYTPATMDIPVARRSTADLVERQRKGLFSYPSHDDDVVHDGGRCARCSVRVVATRSLSTTSRDGGDAPFSGRFYFDLAILQWAMYDAIGITPAETNRTTGGFQPEIVVPAGNPLRGWSGLFRSWRRLLMLWGLGKFRRKLPDAIETVVRENRQAREMNLTPLTDAQLLAEFQRRSAVGNRFTPAIQLAAAYYGAWMTVLQDLLGRLTGDRKQSLVTHLLAASGSVASASMDIDWSISQRSLRRDPHAQAALAAADHNAGRNLTANLNSAKRSLSI